MQYPNLRQDPEIAHLDDEARIGGAADESVELLDFSAFALPSHPQALLFVPLPHAMEKKEAVRAPARMLRVERLDPESRCLQNFGITRQCFCGSVWIITENGEVDMRIQVAERLHFHVRNQIVDPLDAVEHGGHDHHGARRRRHVIEIEPRQPSRGNEVVDDPLQNLDGQLARGHEREERHSRKHRALPTVLVGIEDGRQHQKPGPGRNGTEIDGRRVGEKPPSKPRLETRLPPNAFLEGASPAANQVITDVPGPRLGGLFGSPSRPFDALERHPNLTFPSGIGQFLDCMSIAIPAAEIHPAVHPGRIALQDLLDEADTFEKIAPVERRD